MTARAAARWRTTRAAGVACGVCGKVGTCTVAPDGSAFKCWRDGGEVTQMKPNGHANGDRHTNGSGTGYVGLAHRRGKARAVVATGVEKYTPRVYPTAEAAADAARASAAREAKEPVTPNGVWSYVAGGRERLQVLRFDTADGDKVFRPIHPTKKGWKLGDPSGPLPLYRLGELPAGGTVWVCEGEKAADAARGLGLAAVTSAHGSSAANRSDWSSLAGRDVVVLPDADAPGRKYAAEVTALLSALDPPATVRVVELPGLPDGGDVVEYADGFGDAADPDNVRRNVEALASATRPVDPADVVGGPVLTCMADVEPREVAWLWDGRIALGRVTLLVGVPGGGKSFATCDMAARVSTGTPWPDGAPCPSGSVVLICAEDDPGDTIRPRLDACYADVAKVHLLRAVTRVVEDGKLQEVMFTLADVRALEHVLRRLPDCKLVVIDPIGSFLGGGTDAHRDNEVRAVLAPVAALAERYGAAVLIVAHRRKSAGGSADESALGSRAFTGLARAVMHLSRDPDDPSRRLLLPGKNNLAAEGTGLAFTLAGHPVPAVVWERDPVTMTADEALVAEGERASRGDGGADEEDGTRRPGPKPTARTTACVWLTELLAAGPMRVGNAAKPEANTIMRAVKDAGLSVGTLRRARELLGIKPYKGDYDGGWFWKLPDLASDPANCGRPGPSGYDSDAAGEGEGKGVQAARTSEACAPSGEPAQVGPQPPESGPVGLPDGMTPPVLCAPSRGALFGRQLATVPPEPVQVAQVPRPAGRKDEREPHTQEASS